MTYDTGILGITAVLEQLDRGRRAPLWTPHGNAVATREGGRLHFDGPPKAVELAWQRYDAVAQMGLFPREGATDG